MANPSPERFIPRYDSSHLPRWFIREAVSAFELEGKQIAAFLAIADGLNADGVSRTSNSLIAERGKMARSTAIYSVGQLVEYGLIIRLTEKRSGAIGCYAIPRERPPAPGELPF